MAFVDPTGEAGLTIGPGVLTVNPEAEARFRRYVGEQVTKLQRARNKHFEKEGSGSLFTET
jgi:hypothetical protein